jgi:hypothetical protein
LEGLPEQIRELIPVPVDPADPPEPPAAVAPKGKGPKGKGPVVSAPKRKGRKPQRKRRT